MSEVPVIETERLRLRERTPDDAESLYPCLSDAGLMTWWSRAPFTSVEEVRKSFTPDETWAGWRAWAITRQGDDRAIGYVAAGEKRQGGVSEIGYVLERAAWGGGIASEAVSALIGHLFASGQRRVFADTDPDNVASNGLLKRLGFTLEGRLRGEWETHIGVRDSLIWGLLAEEWRK
ncbi:MAG: family acetyltransferase [Sphingomonas bacterium]|uniref:GNAT family N-acetyltransferase n=1 Tax=Sphingomonas bacterium TaxID=1895847 RepID=UPI0026120235|nr:GNAT family protein [Sphingomonas bacterium]MDB5706832.1 family acetyltransferase [Sphingomonas bacterium]